jgi:hypothetical protein
MLGAFRLLGALSLLFYLPAFGDRTQLFVFLSQAQNLALGSVLGGVYVHEFSHYSLARIWSSEVTISWKYGILPRRINYRSPDEVPAGMFRLIGGAPLWACICGLLTFLVLVISGSPLDAATPLILIGFSGGLFISLSDSDIFAVRHPVAFQRYASDHSDFDPDIAAGYRELL